MNQVISNSSNSVLDLLACPKCHSRFRFEGEALICSSCGTKFESRSGIPCFLPPQQAERFASAQAAEEKYHEETWSHIDFTGLRGVTSVDDYRDWLESFYRIGLSPFGLATSYFRDKAVVEIGSGPFGFLSCLPCGRGLAIDPLMVSFTGYMRKHWDERILRIAAMGEELPIPSGTFDVALAINTLDHTLEPDKILKEAFRVLKPGGLFLIENNVKSRPGKWISVAGERLGIKRLTEIYHPHALTKGDLAEGCKRTGFDVLIDYTAQASTPEHVRSQWGWKHAIRHRVENEHMFWLLAQKPGGSKT
jgi:SAM-dependent methyltransferase